MRRSVPSSPDPRSARETFRRLYGRDPEGVARAPGRVNLIGEHIDYSGGTVLPIAIGLSACAWGAAGAPGRLRVASTRFPQAGFAERALPDPSRDPASPWADYVAGAVAEAARAGAAPEGLDVLVDSDVPAGSGLSSSAAIEVASLALAAGLAGVALDPLDLARMARRAENEFVGVPCGLMDQAASACCRAGFALALDCSATAAPPEHAPFPDDLAVVVAHCGVARGLAGSEYAKRRAECDAALAFLNRLARDEFAELCAVPIDAVRAAERDAPPEVRLATRRARFAVEENARVGEFRRALAAGEPAKAGRLMDESHFGLRDLYEVSIPALDDLTAFARALDGALGSRLTGAGFGGCTATLVDRTKAEAVAEALRARLRAAGVPPLAFATRAEAGAEFERLGSPGAPPAPS